MTKEELKQKLDELIGKPFDRWSDNSYTFRKLLMEYVKQFLSEEVSKNAYDSIDHNNIVIRVFGDGLSSHTFISVKTSRKNLAPSRWDDAEWILKSYELPDDIEEKCAKVNEMMSTSIKIKNDKLNEAKRDFKTIKELFSNKSKYEVLSILDNINKYRYDLED